MRRGHSTGLQRGGLSYRGVCSSSLDEKTSEGLTTSQMQQSLLLTSTALLLQNGGFPFGGLPVGAIAGPAAALLPSGNAPDTQAHVEAAAWG